MQEIFQHTERVKREVMAKIAEQTTQISEMKGEYENIVHKEVEVSKAPEMKTAEVKPPEVTLEDLNIMKRMIFEMKDFTIQTDNFVR